MEKREATYKFVGFFELICDASFAYFCSKTSDEMSYEQNRFARTSIISSALSLEAFANCLMDSLTIPKRTLSELDRLPPLGKIDIYLKFSGSELLDRGKPEVQKISELIKSRNDFVHVKSSKTQSEISLAELQTMPAPEYDFAIKPKFHDNLGICAMAFAWVDHDALKSLMAISSFFKYVMSKLEAAHIDNIQNNLVSRVYFDDKSMFTLPDSYTSEIERLQSVGVDFSMLLPSTS